MFVIKLVKYVTVIPVIKDFNNKLVIRRIVSFKKSKEQEERNYHMMANFKFGSISRDSNFFDPEFIKKIKGKDFEEVKEIIKKRIEKDYKSLNFDFNNFFKSVKGEWYKVEEEYIKRLEKIIKKPFLAKKVICYATILPRCNYWYGLPYPWFKLSILYPKSKWNQVCMHEMMHFMFHWHYWDYCLKFLDEKLVWHLKEAITFLLNEEFSDLINEKDMGYPSHQNLRKDLIAVWRKNKDFQKFLDKSLPIVKKYELELTTK